MRFYRLFLIFAWGFTLGVEAQSPSHEGESTPVLKGAAAAEERCTPVPVGNNVYFDLPENNFERPDYKYSPDGRYVAVSNVGTSRLSVLDLQEGRIVFSEKEVDVDSLHFAPGVVAYKQGDGKWDGGRGLTFKVFDLNSEKVKSVTPAKAFERRISPDGRKVVTYFDDDKSLMLSDPVTGQDIILPLDLKQRGDLEFTPDSGFVVLEGEEEVVVVDADKGAVERFPKPKNQKRLKITRQGVIIFTDDLADENTVKLIDTRSNRVRDVAVKGVSLYNAHLSEDEKSFFFPSYEKGGGTLDLSSGKLSFQTLPGTEGFRSYRHYLPQKNGEALLVQDDDRKIFSVYRPGQKEDGHVSSRYGEVKVHGDRVALIAPRGEFSLYDSSSRSMIDLTQSQVSELGFETDPFTPDGRRALFWERQNVLTAYDLKTQCTGAPVEVKWGEASALTGRRQVLEDTLCGLPFSEAAWERYAPSNVTGPLDEEQTVAYLLRFQKVGGLDLTRHLPILMGLLGSDQVRTKYPDLVNAVLSNVLSVSNNLYEYLLRRGTPASSKSSRDSCRTPEEKAKMTRVAREHLLRLKTRNGDKSRVEDWNSLVPLRAPLSRLPVEERKGYVQNIKESLASGAADTSRFSGIHYSKILKLVQPHAASYFGVSRGEILSDLTFVREGSQLTPVIVSSDSIEDAADKGMNAFGFYTHTLPGVMIPLQGPAEISVPLNAKSPTPNTVQWKHDKDEFTAEVKLTLPPAKGPVAAASKSPPYEELWGEEKLLRGAVVTGSNLGHDAEEVYTAYKDYFRSEGFKLEAEEPIPNLKTTLKDGIRSGAIDYFIKEAHSDGDENNLFGIDKTAVRTKAVKIHADGRKEEVWIFGQAQKPEAGPTISNAEFGSWIQQREKDKKGPLVYFNTSCWSFNKAVNEIAAAGQSNKLIDIPSTNVVRIFKNVSDGGPSLMLSAFREGKSYEEIRKALEQNTGYKNHQYNGFIFPDEREYFEKVFRVLQAPVTTEVRLKKNGQPYDFAEALWR